LTLYILDTNAISDLIINHAQVSRHAAERLVAGDTLGLCRPIHYEILRGLLWRNAMNKLRVYTLRIVPIMTWIEMTNSDWDEAARLWAAARQQGKQLGDPDLFLAALSQRVGAVIVSSDADYDAFPGPREDWRV
jgi:predicted nucleic acid-binding protein